MTDSLSAVKGMFTSGGASAAGATDSVATAQSLFSGAQGAGKSAVTGKAVGSASQSSALKEMAIRSGGALLTNQLISAFNKPVDAEKELRKEKARSAQAAAEGVARHKKAKSAGGYGSTISPNTTVGGSSLAR